METLIRKRPMQGVTVAAPIIYGSVAFWLGKKADDTATHRWTLFIRGPNDEDLSTFISHVAFSLHPSFSEPIRILHSPPFEVTETGWGEFEAGIRIFFRDSTEQPIDLLHGLKLYHANSQLSQTKPVVAESYDEIVFTDPDEDFYTFLMLYMKTPDDGSGNRSNKKPNTLPYQEEFRPVFDDENDLQQLTFIQHHLQAEIAKAKAELAYLDAEWNAESGIQEKESNAALTKINIGLGVQPLHESHGVAAGISIGVTSSASVPPILPITKATALSGGRSQKEKTGGGAAKKTAVMSNLTFAEANVATHTIPSSISMSGPTGTVTSTSTMASNQKKSAAQRKSVNDASKMKPPSKIGLGIIPTAGVALSSGFTDKPIISSAASDSNSLNISFNKPMPHAAHDGGGN